MLSPGFIIIVIGVSIEKSNTRSFSPLRNRLVGFTRIRENRCKLNGGKKKRRKKKKRILRTTWHRRTEPIRRTDERNRGRVTRFSFFLLIFTYHPATRTTSDALRKGVQNVFVFFFNTNRLHCLLESRTFLSVFCQSAKYTCAYAR